jgi:hypothetical protein
VDFVLAHLVQYGHLTFNIGIKRFAFLYYLRFFRLERSEMSHKFAWLERDFSLADFPETAVIVLDLSLRHCPW